MSPAAPSDGAGLTRSEIENWDTSYLDAAATAWRQAATQSEGAFDQHRQNIASPGGTTWEGDAKDAALDRVTGDVVVVGRQAGVLREAADIAEEGRHDINAAASEAIAAITAAEDDGFRVAEDLTLTDTKRVDVFSMRARQNSANEHAEDIRWYADRLAQTDSFVGERLQGKAAELDAIKFEGEGEERDGTVRFVDHTVKHDAEDKDRPGDKKPAAAGQAPGQIGPFAVPKSVEAAAKKPAAKLESKPSGADPELRTPHSLEDMLLPEGRAEPDSNAPPPLSPAQIAEFKTQARKLLQQQGVSPDQIESRVDAMLTETQRIKSELDNLPPYTPPAGPPPARPSYSDGFGDAWRSMEDGVHSLTGQNGFESFKDAWKDMGSGVVETVKDPYGTVFRAIESEIEAFRNNPEYWLGQKGFDAAATAATLPFGGEVAAARGALGDVVHPGVPHEVVHTPPHVDTSSPHVDHPTSEGGHHPIDPGGHGAPGGNPVPFDIDNPIPTARPEFNIVNPLEHMSPELRVLSEQHLTGSGETVLGPYRNPIPGGPSYIELAQQYGASYFDIGDAWDVSTPTQQLAANQHVLDMAITNRDTIRLSVSVDMIKQDTFTGAEIRYLQAHGYEIASDGRSLTPPKAGG